MKRISLLIVMLSLVCFAADFNCYRSLERFCGFTFGETIDVNKYPVFGDTNRGELACHFQLAKPFMQFTDYVLLITPKTHRLAEIWLFKEFKKREEALKYLKNTVAVVGKHYGKDKVDNVASGASIFELLASACDDMYALEFTNDTKILIYGDWTGLFNFKLDDDKVYVKAISRRFQKMAEKEAEEIKLEKERQEQQRAIEREDASLLD